MGLISFRFLSACAIDPLSAADRNYTQLFDLRQTDVLQTKSDGAFLPMERFEGYGSLCYFHSLPRASYLIINKMADMT